MGCKGPAKTVCKKKATPPPERSHLMPPCISSRCQLISSDRKQTRGRLGRVAGGGQERNDKGTWGYPSGGGDKDLDCGDSFRSVCVSQTISTWAFYIGAAYHGVSVTPHNAFWRRVKIEEKLREYRVLPATPSHAPLGSSGRNE